MQADIQGGAARVEDMSGVSGQEHTAGTVSVSLAAVADGAAHRGSVGERQVGAEDTAATADLTMDISGQPKLDVSGREGLVSTRASAGKETTVPVVITNTGTAPAEYVELSGSAPSGWKITFDPKTVDRIAPNDNKEVQALITPTDKAIAGDYVTTVRASARGESASANFRVTVTTSTMWGIAGVGIIGVALLVMVGAVARFGRR